MDDGCKSGSGLKLASNSFSYSECLFLVKVLYDNFNIKASVQSAGKFGVLRVQKATFARVGNSIKLLLR